MVAAVAEAKVDDLVFGLLYQNVEPDTQVCPDHVHQPKPGDDAVATDGNLRGRHSGLTRQTHGKILSGFKLGKIR